jgi:hypothetical protein
MLWGKAVARRRLWSRRDQPWGRAALSGDKASHPFTRATGDLTRPTPLTSSVDTKELSVGRLSAQHAFVTLCAFMETRCVHVPSDHLGIQTR